MSTETEDTVETTTEVTVPPQKSPANTHVLHQCITTALHRFQECQVATAQATAVAAELFAFTVPTGMRHPIVDLNDMLQRLAVMQDRLLATQPAASAVQALMPAWDEHVADPDNLQLPDPVLLAGMAWIVRRDETSAPEAVCRIEDTAKWTAQYLTTHTHRVYEVAPIHIP
ncbi:hypothetical protein FB566_0848 [Stackebrandtia endophytica]|uniref:Uncharacterized protein n=1 Tax=Stackebrandtia endophytica TaxID=1496996 RepID=A0A543ARY8_9ACTN|nr:hypothetical protein [Stackebrandtia endophytica]TQL75350.1 hypothetical protein FB566_0848 [Stackebrandtia endophytica]